MNDWNLALIRHARVLGPLIGAMLLVSITRLFSDSILMEQIHGITTMLLAAGITVYALDALVRLIGLADDRLALMSPRSRWQVLLVNAAVLAALLVLGYIAHVIPTLVHQGMNVADQFWELFAYLVSVCAGFGLMTMLVYLLKPIRTRGTFRSSTWGLVAVTQLGLIAGTVAIVIAVLGEGRWVLGVSGAQGTGNVYAGFVPVTILQAESAHTPILLFVVANACLAAVMWIFGWILSRRKNNFIEL